MKGPHEAPSNIGSKIVGLHQTNIKREMRGKKKKVGGWLGSAFHTLFFEPLLDKHY